MVDQQAKLLGVVHARSRDRMKGLSKDTIEHLEISSEGGGENYPQPADTDLRLTPQDCPKFSYCRAPICPLDPDSVDRIHLKGEPVCYYLRLHAKNGLSASEQVYVPENLALQVAVGVPATNCSVRSPKKSLRACRLESSKRLSSNRSR